MRETVPFMRSWAFACGHPNGTWRAGRGAEGILLGGRSGSGVLRTRFFCDKHSGVCLLSRVLSERLKRLMEQAGPAFELRKLTPVHAQEGWYNAMHSKLWLFDDQVLVTGSPNFTGQSEKNLENIVVIRDVTAVDDARVFFDQAWVKANRVPLDELITHVEYVR